jgi:hypothetical protein
MQTFKRLVVGALCSGCATGPTTTPAGDPVTIAPVVRADRLVDGIAPATLLGETTPLDRAIASHYETAATRRSYLMTDKPLYQPGETIWFRVDLRATSTLLGAAPQGLTLQLTSPRGAIVAQKRVLAQNGLARNDLALSTEIEGGEYVLNLLADDGTHDSKHLVINSYEAPRLMKTVEFVRKAYGEGDQVAAAIAIKRATGEALADHALTAVVTIDDVETARLPLRTDHDGKVVARFALPAKLVRGDGLLTILAEDGGVTESIQRRIPIVMKTLQLSLLPEGGDLVAGLPGRVYFMARTTLGKPADVEGKLVDDRGVAVADLASIHDGMGRFELQAAPGRSYHVELAKPAGITAKFAVPAAVADGCVLRGLDQQQPEVLRFAAICTTARTLHVEAVLREKRLGSGLVEVLAGKPAVIELPVDGAAEGVARVTLFSSQDVPLAERLVYHGRGSELRVTITADKASYAPRDPVKLHIHTTDAHGKPVRANLGFAVVDETVLAFANDKSAGILAHLLLEPELGATPDDPIEDPNYYFGDKPDAPAALDALLATRGYRKFEWRPILDAARTGGQP